MATLNIKKVETAPLKIRVSIPADPAPITGYFTGYAKIRSKAENKVLLERIEAEEFKDRDEELLRELYTRFDGLANEEGDCAGDAAWKEILTGSASAYLVPAAIQAYYASYSEARQGNSASRR